RADGFPDKATYRLTLPTSVVMDIRVDSMAPKGASLQVSVDGAPAAAAKWAGGQGAPDPMDIKFPVPAGKHALVLQSTGPDWVGISSIDVGLPVSSLGLIGRRNDHFIEAWIWSRTNVYALDPKVPVSGTVVIGDVPAGSWKVTWWDSVRGAPGASTVVAHPGGTLRLDTPPILRHGAVVLVKAP
ncbi:MAG TPA: hypothetical protein VIJ19_06755, partial [Opitutaceae bacterium]